LILTDDAVKLNAMNSRTVFSFIIRYHLIVLMALLFTCVPPPPSSYPPAPKMIPGEPTVRVGLVWGADTLSFSADEDFILSSASGRPIADGVSASWSAWIESSKPAVPMFNVVLGSFQELNSAYAHQQDLASAGIVSRIQIVSNSIRVDGRIVELDRKHRVVLIPSFDSEDSARAVRDQLSGFDAFVTRETAIPSEGIIRLLREETSDTFTFAGPAVIRCKALTVRGLSVGTGFHWERTENRTYPEVLRLELDSSGKLALVNEVPVETYLAGVLPAEMSASFPLEALKAQAVAARSELFSKIGLIHRAEPFDVCADVHCQAYAGLSRKAPTTDRATAETRGLVLWKDGVCDAVYSAVCGGHSESSAMVWGGDKSYLSGDYDGPDDLNWYGSLQNERHVKRWIADNPSANCNTTALNAPGLDYTKKYFRWEVRIEQAELQELLFRKSNVMVGDILSLEPLERGVSGRVTRLKINGSQGEWVIQGELAIRKALSQSTLWSSCFTVLTEGGFPPQTFVLKGAGFGHGVGMCQTGAAVMALDGKRFDKILKHFYRGATIKRIY
jgi:SpoIID/LytB domain protein